jgi:glycogen debranching enzyme
MIFFLALDMKFRFILCLLILTPFLIWSQEHILTVGLLKTTGSEWQEREIKAACRFINRSDSLKGKIIPITEKKLTPELLRSCDVVWIHRPDSTPFGSVETDPAFLGILTNYVNGGGHLLLTLEAMRFLNLLGAEPVPVQSAIVSLVDEGYGRQAGLHSFRSHPVFQGLHGGANIYFPEKDESCRQLGFFGQTVPSRGRVIAVDWSYIFIHDRSKLMFEYEFGKGRIIAIGAYAYFDAPNRCENELDYFMNRVIHYLARGHPEMTTHYWNYDTCRILPFTFEAVSDRTSKTSVILPHLFRWPDTLEATALDERFATDHLWDIATHCMLVMGVEKGGIEELWAHPFMALRDFEAGIQFTGRDTVYWLNNMRPEVEMRPASLKRTYKFHGCYLTETITAGEDDPVCIIHYDYKGLNRARLIYRYRSNFRFMWPYDAGALGSLRCGRDSLLNAFIITDTASEFACLVGAGKITEDNMIGQYSTFMGSGMTLNGIPTNEFIIMAQAAADLEMNDGLDVVIAASGEGLKHVVRTYLRALRGPQRVYLETVAYTRAVLSDHLMITTPDAVFNEGYRWAVTAADRFFVHTPGVGHSLVAGYSTTRYGWDGGQQVNGRPGYAWYFGRDGEWSGMALLDEGDFGKVKEILKLYQSYQDINGKIFHELTTSGVVHYDAADATPLYIILAGKYLHHSGDLDFIHKSWGHIKRAIDFCFSTDTDGDHLIENTNVGHGWVEGGHLYGTQTTLYLAACWAKALEEAAYMAEHLESRYGKRHLTAEVTRYRKEAATVNKIIDGEFWNTDLRYYNDGRYRDGTYLSVPTVQACVPLYFGQAAPQHAQDVLTRIAGNRFTTDWGVRIIADDSPYFNPDGYHEGSVWPLFTGWAALAEYAYGHYVQGFSHIMDNLQDYRYWSRGFIDEVLNGRVYKPSGVCPHQCWSETMVLQPVIEGLLGLKVSAPDHSLTLSPRLPSDWDSLTVTGLHVGGQQIDFHMRRRSQTYSYIFKKTGVEPLEVTFSPSLPAGWQLLSVSVNDVPVEAEWHSADQNETAQLSFRLDDSCSVVFKGTGGIGVVPVLAQPKPGYRSEGFRIIDCKPEGKNYRVILEGNRHTSGKFRIYLPDRKISGIDHGELLETTGALSTIGITFNTGEKQYVTKEILIRLTE